MPTDPLAHLQEELHALDAAGLLRQPADALPSDVLTFCSNDYLGRASVPASSAAAGAGAARLLGGERTEHRAAERAIADWVGLDDALLFTSGYAANVGLLSSLIGPDDLVVSDALNHASIIDGIRLSRAKAIVVPHNDLEATAAALAHRGRRRAWVVVESYYSMDADGPDLSALRTLCSANGAALLVDEAHALGVLGPGGAGRCAEAGVRPDALVGTLGKSLGSQGAFVAGSPSLRSWLWNRARSFVFSTGLAPSAAASAMASLAWLRSHPDAPRSVLRSADTLRALLAKADLGAARLIGFGHVLPVLVGAPSVALAVAAELRTRGVLAHAVRPPTVPEGTARLRLTVTVRHTEANLVHAARALEAALGAAR